MADHYSDSDSKGLPRWVKVAAIVAIILILLVIGMFLIMGGMSGGQFGPGSH